MTDRIHLAIDKQGRMSVGRLGLRDGYVVAEPLSDGSGWIIRSAKLLTDAEIDVLSRPTNVAAVKRGLKDVEAGRTRPRQPRR